MDTPFHLRRRLISSIILLAIPLSMVAICMAAASMPALASPSTEPDRKAAQPNILLILVDDLNDWIGVLGGHPNAQTPNMDRLADRGTLFTNAHAAVPLCAPTRTALMTGLRASTTGIYGQVNVSDIRANEAAGNAILLPDYFRSHGYVTIATGKTFHEGSPRSVYDIVGQERRDFGPYPPQRMNWTPPPGMDTSTDWGAFPQSDTLMPDHRNAVWIADQLQKPYDQPFFMAVGFVRPHVPLHVPQAWFDRHPLEQVTLPPHHADPYQGLSETAIRFSEQERMPSFPFMGVGTRWQESVQAYLACVTFVDHYVGVVLDALERSPHADQTIIVLMSDHGYHVGTKGMWSKHTLWQESTRVPLIISRPEDRASAASTSQAALATPPAPPRRTHRPVSHMDLYPTLLDLAGLPANPANEGRSLMPLLDDPDAEGYDAALITHGYGNHAVRTERWHYIRYEDGTEELYDQWTDPNQWNNLADFGQYAGMISELKRHLPDWDAPWDPAAAQGSHYNEYMKDLFERHRADP